MGDGSTRRKPAQPRRQDDAPSDQFDLFGAEPLPEPPPSPASSASGTKRKRAASGKPRDVTHDAAAGDAPLPDDDVARTAEPALGAAPGAGDAINGEVDAGAGAGAGADADAEAKADAKAKAERNPEADGPDKPADTAAPADSTATPPLPGFDAPPPAAPPKKRPRRRGVAPAAISDEVAVTARKLPPHVRLGTSSWYFPGWKDIVYGDDYAQSKLSREGLEAYGAHPLLKSVSLDRSFYAPLTVADYLRYAQQVPDDFRFVVKAPALVTDAVLRGTRGEPAGPNPAFLNAQLAADEFVRPCIEGLGRKAGALVFQFPPMPDALLADPAALVDRLSAFLGALPPLPDDQDGPRYAVEIRDASLLTPRFIRALAAAGVRYCVGLHAKMPDPLRQAAALALLDGEPSGPLIVRWSLHGGFKYEQAKAKYEPFDRLVDEDPHTRSALAELAARYVLAGQPVLITVNNKAEGSAPLSCIALAKEIAAACARWRGEAA
ncbi:DUF72 domain-containing protein [Burkholderia oklahomensis]|uniref:DUF72 domain-containing protein n=1 Tax=Burkholderia oklahomensis TaxID=342113 RepID=UPI00016A9ABA|nr:DUF72 domain-containing protein [Burkholderia oklahomensis]AJX31426.1 hypothetical protein BG90_783 [Burkholderia oklahomensis C6786]AOI46918.1 hypothetical protein WI23_14695 [Burkholderia oklahomensis C6786]KUY58427.1 hypothetical protein WI23_17640 [Burkholderia oklahomensis C6786]MBI0360414.1 DUF72 domain-containing protein [Burkholderia oklahomensis]SUW59794.1 Protein of uncharacterised function DUF72 [Burkholderia oklahomensis]